MKIQDILFLIVLLLLLWKHNARLITYVGLGCIVIAIPLFALHVFFTAERLIWYAGAFFLLTIILQAIQLRKDI